MVSLNTSAVTTAPPPTVGRTRHLLTPLPEPGHFLFVVDNSAAEKMVCPTLAANYLVEGREPHPTNAALIFGGALHVGIETLLKGPKLVRIPGEYNLTEDPENLRKDDGLESPEDLLIRAGTDLAAFFTKQGTILDEYRTLTNALETLRYYAQRITFPDYGMRILSDDRGPLIERAFELPLGVLEVGAWVNVPGVKDFQYGVQFKSEDDRRVWVSHIHVAWAGRIDVVAFCNGANRIVDHKTTSQGGPDFVSDFQLSSQTRGYVWAAQQLWRDLQVTGFCLDAIKLKRPAKGCGLMDKGPRGGESALDFFRHYFDYTPESIAAWAENQLTRVEDFIHSLVRGYFPQESTYCFNRKYGRCPYHEVCVLATDNPAGAKRLLHSDAFRQVTWNPTADR